jgi:hypothetical protein
MSIVFIVVKYSHPEAELISDRLVTLTNTAGYQSFLGYREIRDRQLTDGTQWMPFIKQQLAQAQLCLLVYDPLLRGGLVEAGIAFAYAIPIWLIVQRDLAISRSVLGCATRLFRYDRLHDLEQQLAQAYRTLPDAISPTAPRR